MASPKAIMEHADLSEEALLDRYRAGDAGAIATLYDLYHEGLYAYLRSLLGEAQQSEDIVQETFVRLLDYALEKRIDSVKAFLYTVARNLAMESLRSAALRGKHLPLVGQNNARRTVEKDARLEELQKSALAALEELPADQRETLVLKIQGQLTFPEIAEITGVSASTAASRYRYALEKLAERLSSKEVGDES